MYVTHHRRRFAQTRRPFVLLSLPLTTYFRPLKQFRFFVIISNRYFSMLRDLFPTHCRPLYQGRILTLLHFGATFLLIAWSASLRSSKLTSSNSMSSSSVFPRTSCSTTSSSGITRESTMIEYHGGDNTTVRSLS